MSSVRTSIGLIGCSRIAKSAVVQPARLTGARVAAVASRDRCRAERFAAENDIASAIAGYHQLLRRDDIDAVYVSTPNALHAEWVLAAIEAGKHVLVEKPICTNIKDMTAIEQSATNCGVVVMEALMVEHHPWQTHVRELVSSARLGRLVRLESRIAFELSALDAHSVEHRRRPDLGGGVLLDEGPYWLQFVQSVVGLRVRSHDCVSLFAETGYDITTTAWLHLEGSIAASLYSSLRGPYEADHRLFFEGGGVRVGNFFRASLGRFKISVKADGPMASAPGIDAVFQPQNYYLNQLEAFVGAIEGSRPRPSLDPCLERTNLLLNLHAQARDPSTTAGAAGGGVGE